MNKIYLLTILLGLSTIISGLATSSLARGESELNRRRHNDDDDDEDDDEDEDETEITCLVKSGLAC